jgi:hypothetical protein
MSASRAGLKPSAYSERACGKAGVEDSGIELEIEREAIVDELLDVERDLSAIYRAIIGEADFDGDVETGVFVGMCVEGERRGEECVGIEEQIHLR